MICKNVTMLPSSTDPCPVTSKYICLNPVQSVALKKLVSLLQTWQVSDFGRTHTKFVASESFTVDVGQA